MIMGDTKMNNFATRAIEGLLFRKPELFLVSNLKFPVDLMGELKFSKKYLDNNELRNYLQLPEGLTLIAKLLAIICTTNQLYLRKIYWRLV